MIHVMTEDSKDGFKIVEKIVEIYFENSVNITTTSFQGIWDFDVKLKEKIEAISDTDILVIIFDDVMESPIVECEMLRAYRYVKGNHLESRIYWIPTHSFEIEVLLTIGIELFCNEEYYDMYFKKLRDLYFKTNELLDLTTYTKNDVQYNDWYDKVKKEKKKRSKYKILSEADFERAITIESIAKDILKEVFKDNENLVKPMGDCWYDGCCIKHKESCKHFDVRKLNADPMIKLKWLIQNTGYIKLIKLLEKLTNTKINIESVELEDIVLEEMRI